MDVDIAILDTGVYIGTNPDGSARSHLDLNLRWVSDCTQAILYPLLPGGCRGSGDFQDYHGHGTHVAGIAAALDNDIGSVGVAPGATLWSFKVLRADGTGTTGMILAGIDAVASKAAEIEVANMSLGFVGTSQAIDDAIAAATNVGVTFVVAGGNDAIDASQFSPANGPYVVTVSALADFDGLPGGLGAPTCRQDVDDTLADFSNFGPAVEIAAPGVCIFSTWLNDGYNTISGTSMASPFVAGAVARYIAQSDAPTANRSDVEAIKTAVIGAGISQSSACGFTDVDSSPEPMAFVNGPAYGGDGACEDGSVANASPVADFSYNCVDLSCDFIDESTDSDGTIDSREWDFAGLAESTEPNPGFVFAAEGTYAVSLTVTDDEGASSMTTRNVTVTDSAVPNQPPIASFSASCTDLDCSFTSTSSDPDGDPLTYAWTFGDGDTASSANPTHIYAAAGSYTVSLTVSDGVDADMASSAVTVTEPSASTVITAGVYPVLISGRDASIEIGVFDGDGVFVGGATVEGVWTYLDRRGRARTLADGAVSADEPPTGSLANAKVENRFPRESDVVSFCVTQITAPGYEYVAPPLTCGFPLG
jgi:PKD repeat protein